MQKPVHGRIPIGLGTITGLVGAILAAITPVINGLIALIENVEVHWSSAEKLGLIAGAALAAFTLVSRGVQAVVAIIKGGG